MPMKINGLTLLAACVLGTLAACISHYRAQRRHQGQQVQRQRPQRASRNGTAARYHRRRSAVWGA